MPAPTQALPPYLSYSTSLITRPGGGVKTSTTLVEVPLTYYGPSIPLGTNGVWTYGGLTSPASSLTRSTPTPTSSSSSPSPSSVTSTPSATPSTTAIPSTSTSISSTSVIPSTSISVSSSSALTSSPISSFSSSPTSLPLSSSVPSTSGSPTSSSSTSSSTPGAAQSGSPLNTNTMIGIIIGSIFGALIILLLFLLFLRWRRQRQNGGYQTPIWTGWEVVDPTAIERASGGEEDRPAGEGSPRGSGEEADSFLRRSRSAADAADMADTSARLVSVPATSTGNNGNTNSSGGSGPTDSTAVSDYGVLLERADYEGPEPYTPTYIPARPSTDLGFIEDRAVVQHIISPSELLRMESEREENDGRLPTAMRNLPPEEYSPLIPPRPLDPDRVPTPSSQKSSSSILSAHDLDDPMVLTARRVRMSQVGSPSNTSRSQSDLRLEDTNPPPSRPASGGTWGSLGLGGIARLSRLSWFKGMREAFQQDSPSRSTSTSRHASRQASWVGRALADRDLEVGRALLASEAEKRPGGSGYSAQGERPMSSISTKSAVSGNTIYHDAHSSPGTPPPLPPLPRAHVSGSDSQIDVTQTAPPAYRSTSDSAAGPVDDILDTPVPASISQFSSASSRGGMPFPPGLGMGQLPTPKSWFESSSSEAGGDLGITIDVLEDEPPRAGDRWRFMARNASLSYPEHRSSFGVPNIIHPTEIEAISEVGSLHSMRSHLSPHSPRSSGSAPASSHNLTGSNSSRPSGHSQGRTASSGVSLAHSTSISSDGRRRTRGAISPALSAFGGQDIPSSLAFPKPQPPLPAYTPRSPLSDTDATVRLTTTGTSITGSDDTAGTVGQHVARHSTEPDLQLLSMPWATGLD